MRLLSYDDLRPVKGIQYSKVQLWRLEKRGKFPKRVQTGIGQTSRVAWAEHEIDDWIAECIRARDEAGSAPTAKVRGRAKQKTDDATAQREDAEVA